MAKKTIHHFRTTNITNQNSKKNTPIAKTGEITVIKPDGTIIKHKPAIKKTPHIEKLSEDCKKEIRRTIRIGYSQKPLPELSQSVKILKRLATEIDKPNVPKISTEYLYDFDQPEKKLQGIGVRLGYSGLDVDGGIVLYAQLRIGSRHKLFLKQVEEAIFVNIEKKTTETYQFLDVKTAKKKYKWFAPDIQYMLDQCILRAKFKNLVSKLVGKFTRAIADYVIFLEEHGKHELVEHLMSDDAGIQASDPIPFIKLQKQSSMHTDSNNDDDTLHTGDKICCKLTSIVTVANTFKCVEEGHEMIPVQLEVMLKHKSEELPQTVEVDAYYCRQCRRIFMYTSEFESIRNYLENHLYYVFNRFSVNGMLMGYMHSTETWADESILREAGYSVGQDSYLNQQERLTILQALNDRGVPYHLIASYLNTFINVLGASTTRNMTSATASWKSDLAKIKELYTEGLMR